MIGVALTDRFIESSYEAPYHNIEQSRTQGHIHILSIIIMMKD